MEIKRREILPMKNYPQFLEEGRNDFFQLIDVRSSGSVYSISDFECCRTIGEGAFARVLLAKTINDRKHYAMKVLSKRKLVQSKQVQYAINEKKVLQALNHPFTVHLEYAFQDNSYLYMGLPFVPGGEMFIHLRARRKFEEPLSRFYGAQVVLALEYLHFCSTLFRDIKPENLLVDANGYLKLTDFGFSKIITDRTYTMCGTPEYMAPEVILSKGYGKSVDWWAFGILLFEMTAGYPPFHSLDPMGIYEKSVQTTYAMPKFFSHDLQDLISNLIQKDLSKRYGTLKGGVDDIKRHEWFQTINWISLFNGKVEPPFVPLVRTPEDATNFDDYDEVPLETSEKNPYGTLFDDF